MQNKNEFSERTKKILSARAAQTCSNPKCLRPTSGPHSDLNKSTIIGKAAHIAGKSPGSARHDKSMTAEERSCISNAIWLCSVCHDLIDRDERLYSIERLLSWKVQHENRIQFAMVRNIDFSVGFAPVSEVVIRKNASDKTKFDIYLIDQTTNKKKYFCTLSDIFFRHYHNSEFVKDLLYIIHRTGGDEGYEKNENWTDELWAYSKNKPAKKIYTNRGLDFRVSDDGLFISLLYSSKNNKEEVILINEQGKILKKIVQKEFGKIKFKAGRPLQLLPSLLVWHEHTIWFYSGFGPSIINLFSLNADNGQFARYELPRSFGSRDVAFNPFNGKIVYSDYPVFFDVESNEEFIQSKEEVKLRVFDVYAMTEEVIAISEAKEFKPKWIDEKTIEYDDPHNGERIYKAI